MHGCQHTLKFALFFNKVVAYHPGSTPCGNPIVPGEQERFTSSKKKGVQWWGDTSSWQGGANRLGQGGVVWDSTRGSQSIVLAPAVTDEERNRFPIYIVPKAASPESFVFGYSCLYLCLQWKHLPEPKVNFWVRRGMQWKYLNSHLRASCAIDKQ